MVTCACGLATAAPLYSVCVGQVHSYSLARHVCNTRDLVETLNLFICSKCFAVHLNSYSDHIVKVKMLFSAHKVWLILVGT